MIKWKNQYIVFIMMFLGLVVSVYFMFLDAKFQSKLIKITKENTIKVMVKEAYNERGFYILNNKYIVKSNTYILGEGYGLSIDKAIWRPKKEKYIPRISDITAPFEIYKKSNSDTLELTKGGKTIYLLLKKNYIEETEH